MTDYDTPAFDRIFRRLASVFRLRMKPADFVELRHHYFEILKAHAIDAVQAAATRYSENHRTFPKPTDWLAELASRTATPVAPADRRTMRVDEADELARATALGYEDAPCHCVQCYAAGISHRPIRYVPTEFGDAEQEKAFNPRRGVVEIVGHWAHGEELVRWYVARDAFFALAKKAPRTLFDAVAIIVGERVPGMEG